MDSYDLRSAIEGAFEYSSEINKYVDDKAPWKISIESIENQKELENILFILVSNLRNVALMLLPFFPIKMNELLTRIGTPYDETISLSDNLLLRPTSFFVKEKGEPLYMRIAK